MLRLATVPLRGRNVHQTNLMCPAAGVYEEEEPEAADSEDDDDLLAAAAAAVEAQEMKSKGKKHLGILGKKGKKDKDKEQLPAAGLVASPAKVSGSTYAASMRA